MKFRGRSLACMTLMLLAGCSGCILSVNSRSTRSGSFVSEDVSDRLVVGETTKQWLIDRLGAPTSEEQLSDGTEVLKYVSKLRKSAHVDILLLLDVSDVKETIETFVFEVKDGVVVRYDRSSRPASDPGVDE